MIDKIILFKIKEDSFYILKEDVWKFSTFFIAGLIPLIIYILRNSKSLTFKIISIVLPLLVIVIGWVSFIKKEQKPVSISLKIV